VTVLPAGASYNEFCSYVRDIREDVHDDELEDLWDWRQKLLGIRIDTGRGFRSQMPVDEQHLTREQRGRKAEVEAKASGRNIERLPEKAYF
tara:strand:- start:1019 stop:1291 length:273 start_codon:yes stop_codon:yes gene_type:complete